LDRLDSLKGNVMQKVNPYPIMYFHDRKWIAGGEQSLLTLIRHLDKKKFEPHFVISTEGEFSNALEAENISIHYVPFHSFKAFRIHQVIKTIQRLEALCHEVQPSVIHSNAPRTNLYAGIVGRRLHIPIVWHARNLIASGMIDVDRYFSFFPQRVICNSDAIRSRFRTLGGYLGNATTIHTGVDTDSFCPNLEKARCFRDSLGFGNEPLIGLVGRIGPGKGHETFLDAASRVHREFPMAQFLIVGRAEDQEDERREERLKTQAKSLGLDRNVFFLGYRKDTPSVMAALNVLVVSSWAEPFGRVVLEGSSSGLPVVGTNSGGTPEVITNGENGLLVPPKDEQKMAEAILRLLRSKEEAKKMGEKGRRKVLENFTLEIHAKKMENLYLSIVSSPPHPFPIFDQKKFREFDISSQKKAEGLSILIPTWNGKEVLERCLHSIYQSPPKMPYEVVVIDNHSTDGTDEMLQRKFPDVSLVSNERNLGYSTALNKGFLESRGRYLLVLNNDIVVHKGSIQGMLQTMEENPTAGLVGGCLQNRDGTFQPSANRRFPNLFDFFLEEIFFFSNLRYHIHKTRVGSSFVKRLWDDQKPQKVSWVGGACMLIRREAIREVGFFDEAFFFYREDCELCYRLQKGGWQVLYDVRFPFTHTWGYSSKNNARKVSMESRRSLLYYAMKHYGFLGFHVAKLMLLMGLMIRYVFLFFIRTFKKDAEERLLFFHEMIVQFGRMKDPTHELEV